MTLEADRSDAWAGQERDGDVRSWWLVRLRWGSVVGQGLIIGLAPRFARLDLPLATLFALTALMAASNALLHLWLRHSGRVITSSWAGSILAFDMLQLTALLYATGGASNPFSVFYLVQITAAAATLGSRWTWVLTALGVSAYAALFALPSGGGAGGDHAAHGFQSHLRAMWLALTLAAALTAFFVTRLTTGLARREREIQRMREAAARRRHLSALTTLAAGAAHELATPLTTVAVAAGELERTLSSWPPDAARRVGEDVRLIRAEVARCREILDEIGCGTGQASGEMPERFTAADLVRDVLSRLRPDAAARVSVSTANAGRLLFLPRRALGRVVLSLVQNALDAAPQHSSAVLAVSADAALEIRIRDEGGGMAADVLARAGEPFFTTKQPGQGLGLGLFLARSLADQLHGRLELQSAPGQGTTAILRLPLEVQVDVQPA